MKTNYKYSVAAVCTAVVLFNFSSCKYPDGPKISLRTKTARLVGEWDVKSIGGDNLGDFEITLEFEKSGDGTYEFSYYGYTDSYDFEWEWVDGKESISMEIDGDDPYEFEIQRLTNDELVWEDEDGDEWEMEKN